MESPFCKVRQHTTSVGLKGQIFPAQWCVNSADLQLALP